MAGIFKDLFGAKSAGKAPQASDDADFADFAHAPAPTPASIASQAQPSAVSAGISAIPTSGRPTTPIVFTKWYRVWERTTVEDFYAEAFVLLFVLVLAVSHVWGTRKNRRIARRWFTNYVPILETEFAVVGFEGRKAVSVEDVETVGLAKAAKAGEESEEGLAGAEVLKEKTPQEFVAYATGRQNVAVLDARIQLAKRYNPALWFAETALGVFFESMADQGEVFQATLFPFDGKEADIVPVPGGKIGSEILEARAKSGASSVYDGFVWAVVNKDYMKRLRDERYDVSLTSTKDHPKLPAWATVMTESAEVTDVLLTADLIKAVEKCGDNFEYIVVTDQPVDKPTKPEETTPKKRVSMSIKIDSTTGASSVDLFAYFIRMADQLVVHARFRPEVLRKVRQTREDEIKKLQRVGADEKAEERLTKREKEKKEKREATLKGLSADEQRKYLDKERDRDFKKNQKKMTRKG
ncbi:MAG: hypothetical protein M1814_002482 [Vezdaea aestivalis]|nr:MAG: hypothetical protein M1814_002482 [Vezdaea aestivalis]